MGGKTRINRYLAAAGFGSRRKCEALIRNGLVAVNGKRLASLATLVDPGVDEVTVEGKRIGDVAGPVVLVLNKPTGVLSTVRDSFRRTTVIDIAREHGYVQRLFPVGRLDQDTSGILLLTNDGKLAYRLTHPRFKIEKTYEVAVEGDVGSETIMTIARGVELDGSMTLPCTVKVLKRTPGVTILELKLREGRKRQIRRMFSICGHRVIALRRTALGPLEFRDCHPGAMRPLTEDERRRLRDVAGLAQSTEEDSL
jgi:23S rRNA pseudouridine2605 synthase